MKTSFIILTVVGVVIGQSLYAQGPSAPTQPRVQVQAPPAPPKPPAPPSVEAKPRPIPAPVVNIRVDLVVTEEGANDPPSRKEVSVTVVNDESGSIRSGGILTPDKPFNNQSLLRVDVRPLVENGRIRTLVTMKYLRPPHFLLEGDQKFEVLLDDGKSLVVSQASSTISDRRMKVEVTATILK